MLQQKREAMVVGKDGGLVGTSGKRSPLPPEKYEEMEQMLRQNRELERELSRLKATRGEEPRAAGIRTRDSYKETVAKDTTGDVRPKVGVIESGEFHIGRRIDSQKDLLTKDTRLLHSRSPPPTISALSGKDSPTIHKKQQSGAQRVTFQSEMLNRVATGESKENGSVAQVERYLPSGRAAVMIREVGNSGVARKGTKGGELSSGKTSALGTDTKTYFEEEHFSTFEAARSDLGSSGAKRIELADISPDDCRKILVEVNFPSSMRRDDTRLAL
eukprot:TRINITY_DN3204_c0_g1_i1.p1 TRINITY_DN3204_c0_g1~~TRINITY_DN3204_c0_g1_i1.p1  ORF type:complete len:273 (+),score=72.06 TRINITY_DN3204_c0_g1_i1:60-878(+)